MALTLTERARRVRLLLLDVDGVLTDGKILLHADGTESKTFDIRDGTGIVLAQKAGVDLNRVREALLGGFASSRVLEVHGERMIKRNYVPGFRTRLYQKDLRLANEAALARILPFTLPFALCPLQAFSNNRILRRRTSTIHDTSAATTSHGHRACREDLAETAGHSSAATLAATAPPVAPARAPSSTSSTGRNRYSASRSGRTRRTSAGAPAPSEVEIVSLSEASTIIVAS